MVVPRVLPWMKQSRERPTFRVQAAEICPFPQVAVMTGERKIVGNIGAAMLPGEDVLDVKSQRFTLLREGAILAVIVRAATDELAEGGVHQPACAWVSVRRALACKMPISVLAET